MNWVYRLLSTGAARIFGNPDDPQNPEVRKKTGRPIRIKRSHVRHHFTWHIRLEIIGKRTTSAIRLANPLIKQKKSRQILTSFRTFRGKITSFRVFLDVRKRAPKVIFSTISVSKKHKKTITRPARIHKKTIHHHSISFDWAFLLTKQELSILLLSPIKKPNDVAGSTG